MGERDLRCGEVETASVRDICVVMGKCINYMREER